MAVASNPMNDAKAKASAIPADPVKPPTKTALGEKDAPKSRPCGPPPLTTTAIEVSTSEPSSKIISTPRNLAPTSTLNADSASTAAHASSVQTHQDSEMPNWLFICSPITAPKKPKIANWMARYATSEA